MFDWVLNTPLLLPNLNLWLICGIRNKEEIAKTKGKNQFLLIIMYNILIGSLVANWTWRPWAPIKS